jgi:sugar (pentulose or hexulose) kinase
MCADVFGRDMELDPAENASLMGAATVAMEKLGVVSDVTKVDIPASKVIQYNPEKQALYAEHYKRYTHWYERTIS